MTVKELLTRAIDTLSEEQALRVMEFIVELRGAEPLASSSWGQVLQSHSLLSWTVEMQDLTPEVSQLRGGRQPDRHPRLGVWMNLDGIERRC